MTKKDFIKQLRVEKYGSFTNALFFDYKNTGSSRGYKFMVYAHSKNCTKKLLIDTFYEWVVKEIQLPYFVLYNYAATDEKRFGVPLSLSYNH
jgi:hypothetical protein